MKARMQSKDNGVLMFINASNPYLELVKVGYVDELEREILGDTGQGMFRVNMADLCAPNLRFYALASIRVAAEAEFSAGLQVEDRGDALCFKGALVATQYRGQGLMTRLLHLVKMLEGMPRPDKPHRAIVRLFPDGQPNVASLRAFQAAGFAIREAGTHVLRYDQSDRHLAASAEENGTLIHFLMLEAPALAACKSLAKLQPDWR
jgi:hypothetical protein